LDILNEAKRYKNTDKELPHYLINLLGQVRHISKHPIPLRILYIDLYYTK